MSATPVQIRRTLCASIVDGALYAVMIGVSESYLGAFAVSLGHDDLSLALLATVPLLVGALIQLLAGAVATLSGTWRRAVVVGAVLQGLSQVGFVSIALTDDSRLWTLLLVKTLFWSSGALLTPVWNAWMAELVEGSLRERFFAHRGGIVYLALVLSYLGGGQLLEEFRQISQLMQGFAVLFSVAVVARLASAFTLQLHVDVTNPAVMGPGTMARVRLALRQGSWRITVLLAAVGFGVHMAAPFFTPYMLRTMQLDYTVYAVLTAVAVFVKAVAFPFAHRVSSRFGLGRMVVVSGLAVAALPALWAVVPSVPGLLVVEVLGGLAWAAFEFASFQLLLDASPSECNVEYFSLSSAGVGIAQLCGALVGSALLATWSLSYTDVFALSGAVRATAVLLIALPLIPAMNRARLRLLVLRPAAIRAAAGVVNRLLVRNSTGKATQRPVDASPVKLSKPGAGSFSPKL